MVGKIDKTPQLDLFRVPLVSFIQKNHELCLLARKIDWESIEESLSIYYCSDNGRPSIPIRKIAGVILLRRIFNVSDERAIDQWIENPYWQYFCGEVYFQHSAPFDPTELIKFRKRIGEEGAEKLLKLSIDLFDKKEIKEKEALVDTTVQEKNITYPTDTKLEKKIIEKCREIAKKEGIKLRQSYVRTIPQLMIDQRFREHPKRRKKARQAARSIHTIAGRMVRDVERKLPAHRQTDYFHDLLIFNMILQQQQSDSNKIYSIHEPHVRCIAKGKEAKKYEFGNKSSFVKTRKSGIIIGAMAFTDNLYDGDTLDDQLQQVERLIGTLPKAVIVDRGYRGRKKVRSVDIVMPKKLPASANSYQKQKIRKQFRARAGIEPTIGHIKDDHRMNRNFLSGIIGDKINTILAAAGYNLKKMLSRLKDEAAKIIQLVVQLIMTVFQNPLRKYA
jgi:IS5 family transposase